jgi:hypothetical protein
MKQEKEKAPGQVPLPETQHRDTGLLKSKSQSLVIRVLTVLALACFSGVAWGQSLTSASPASTYGDLLHISHGNGGADGTFRLIYDGKGNATGVSISTLGLSLATPLGVVSGGTGGSSIPTWNQSTTGTAANITGIAAVANGGTGLPSLTAGYIPFGAGTSAFGSDGGLWWDNANKRLGIGTTSPRATLDVAGSVAIGRTLHVGPPSGSNQLSAAVTAMSDGDTLILEPGVYVQTANVVVPDAVTHFSIVGQGAGITTVRFDSGATAGIVATGTRKENLIVRGLSLKANTTGLGDALAFWGEYENVASNISYMIDNVIAQGDTSSAANEWTNGIHGYGAFNVTIRDLSGRNTTPSSPPTGIAGNAILLDSCVIVHIIGGELVYWDTGLKLEKSADAWRTYGGTVYNYGCEGVTITGVEWYRMNYGIDMRDQTLNVMATDSTLAYMWRRNITDEFASSPGTGMGYNNFTNNWFDTCTTTTGDYQIYLTAPGTVIANNHIENQWNSTNAGGIKLAGTSKCKIIGNTLGWHAGAHISLYNSSYNVISGNTFIANGGGSAYDVYVAGTTGVYSLKNIIAENICPTGITVTANNNYNLVTSNVVTVTDSGTGTVKANNTAY